MSTMDFLGTDPLSRLVRSVRRLSVVREQTTQDNAEDTREIRAFVLQMMREHPEAFANEENFTCAMYCFSGR